MQTSGLIYYFTALGGVKNGFHKITGLRSMDQHRKRKT